MKSTEVIIRYIHTATSTRANIEIDIQNILKNIPNEYKSAVEYTIKDYEILFNELINK